MPRLKNEPLVLIGGGEVDKERGLWCEFLEGPLGELMAEEVGEEAGEVGAEVEVVPVREDPERIVVNFTGAAGGVTVALLRENRPRGLRGLVVLLRVEPLGEVGSKSHSVGCCSASAAARVLLSSRTVGRELWVSLRGVMAISPAEKESFPNSSAASRGVTAEGVEEVVLVLGVAMGGSARVFSPLRSISFCLCLCPRDFSPCDVGGGERARRSSVGAPLLRLVLRGFFGLWLVVAARLPLS